MVPYVTWRNKEGQATLKGEREFKFTSIRPRKRPSARAVAQLGCVHPTRRGHVLEEERMGSLLDGHPGESHQMCRIFAGGGLLVHVALKKQQLKQMMKESVEELGQRLQSTVATTVAKSVGHGDPQPPGIAK